MEFFFRLSAIMLAVVLNVSLTDAEIALAKPILTRSGNQDRPAAPTNDALRQARKAVFGPTLGMGEHVGGKIANYSNFGIVEVGRQTVMIAAADIEGAAHSDAGLLGIWYLERRNNSFIVIGRYPALGREPINGIPKAAMI